MAALASMVLQHATAFTGHAVAPSKGGRMARQGSMDIHGHDSNMFHERTIDVTLFRIGCSGWNYRHWIGDLYPSGTRPEEMLGIYSRSFDTVEIDSTFYRLPAERTVDEWRRRTPSGFLFSAKMSRLATHMRRLQDPARHVGPFMERLQRLDDKLGPVLVQMPPSQGIDLPLLSSFLDSFPPGQRVAVEPRNDEWFVGRTYKMLEERSCALCLVDSDKGAVTGPATADFTYVRWHGRSGHAYSYADEEIVEWIDILQDLGVEEAYCYWNNDLEGAAPRNARRMMESSR